MDYTGNTYRKDVYKTKTWKKTRVAFAIYKNCICEKCGKPIYMSGATPYLPKDKRRTGIVHHKEYLTETNYNDDNIAYNWDNLELLCKDCHELTHHANISCRKDMMFDEEGNIKPR